MTVKQDKVVELLAEGASPTEAMRQAGYSETSIRLPQRVTRAKKVRTQLEKALNKHNINIERIARTINEAFEAEKLIVMGKNSDDSFVDKIPDYAIRLKAADMSIKLLPKQKEDKPEAQPFDSDTLKELLASGNLVELQRIMLSKDQS